MYFSTDEARAAAYAAYKELERMLEADGDLPPGFSQDMSGVTVQVTIPQGTVVSRDKGVTVNKAEGRILKTPTQNLYGWGVLMECFKVARLFKQHNRLERILLKIVERGLRKSVNEKAFAESMPEQARQVADLKAKLSKSMTKRNEATPRMIIREDARRMATVTLQKIRKAA